MNIVNTLTQDRPYLWSKFHGPKMDESTGLTNDEIKKGSGDFYNIKDQMPRPVLKAKAFAYVCENMQLDVNPQDFFPTFGIWNRNDRPLWPLLYKLQVDMKQGLQHIDLWNDVNASGAGTEWVDFDHSVPDWDYIIAQGFPGILANAKKYRAAMAERQGGTLTADQAAYFDGIELSYEAILRTIKRFEDYARAHANGNERVLLVADCLQALQMHEPQTTFELMQFIYLYFMFCEHIDRYQVRSLGNLDNTFLPFVERDFAEGRLNEEQLRTLWDYFLMQWGSIDNYWGHPFYLGGTAKDGSSTINFLSYLILEEFDKLAIPTPKIQLKISKNTPDQFIDTALKMIRRGHSSLVFVSEEQVRRVLLSQGCTDEDARNFLIKGCYEFVPSGYHQWNNTGVGHVNFLKPLEWLFNNGMDTRLKKAFWKDAPALSKLETFDDFYRAYIEGLTAIIEAEVKVGNEFENYIHVINPANVFSGAIRMSMERAKDAFESGCYSNDSVLLGVGFASAVDALMVVRDFVYDQKEITLEELAKCLQANWAGYEKFHEKVMHHPNKYGNGIHDVDQYATRLTNYFSYIVNGRPNAETRHGRWNTSGHCAKQYFELGKKTMASPDGRKDGEEMSKNLSPVQGMDRHGLTALIHSISELDPNSLPGDFPLDVMLHPTTVQGEDGLNVWRSLLRIYLEHGIAIHFNIFDAETLKAAQREPEKYEGLQIRVCGWNTRFNDMPPVEQDLYIRRAENLAE